MFSERARSSIQANGRCVDVVIIGGKCGGMKRIVDKNYTKLYKIIQIYGSFCLRFCSSHSKLGYKVE